MSESTDIPDIPENPEEKSKNTAIKKRKSKATKIREESLHTEDEMPQALSAISDETLLEEHLSAEDNAEEGDGGSSGSGDSGGAEIVTENWYEDEDAATNLDLESLDLDDSSDESPRDVFDVETDEDLLNRIAGVYQIWWNWAHFELTVVSPYIAEIDPAVIIEPERLGSGDDEVEFVYPIIDYGNRLATSKATDMYSAGMSMCKLYYTIEKMIHILIDRLKSGGIDTETEVQVAFDGHQFAQRKAFESIINLSYNVVVSNFDPGAWGERYLEVVKRLADMGYGYPAEAPRETYRNFARTSMGVKR